MVTVLLELGVHPAPDEARHVYCLAQELGASETMALLERALDVVPESCGGAAVVFSGR